jgi:uncharacterized protein (DUF362 family)
MAIRLLMKPSCAEMPFRVTDLRPEDRSMKDMNVAVVDVARETNLSDAFAVALDRLPALLPVSMPQRIVVKPNLCDITSWQTGATTDPEWLSVLSSWLRAQRPGVHIQVVESDAISAYKTFRSCDETFDRLGYREAARKADVELVNLSRQPAWEVAVPGFPTPLQIPELMFQDFFYISLANVKVHPYERFTGTLKNALGLLPQADISQYHVDLPRLIASLYRLCAPDLAILDGRIGLEGKGPIVGEARWLGKLIVGANGLAVDEAACKMIGVGPREVPHLRTVRRSLGHDSRAVTVLGNLDPVNLRFDPTGAHSLIQAKFAVRRFHRKFETLSLRLTAWAFEARKSPRQFIRRVWGRLVK